MIRDPSASPLQTSDAGEGLPFDSLFFSLVLDARTRLRAQTAASARALLSGEAHAGWEQFLWRRLCQAGAKAALWQFETCKAAAGLFLGRQFGSHPDADFFYRRYLGADPQDRLGKLFKEFPALARLCERLVENWVSTVAEFLARLKTDLAALGDHFTGGFFQGPLVSVQAGLSDPHHGGRSVVRLVFADGRGLFYKPRSVCPEVLFGSLVDEINRAGIPHALKVPRCWDRGEYGWMEDVLPHPCDTLAGIRAYYWRSGALLGLIYLAQGVDIHRENVIAAGEHPVPVDLETLAHPQEHVGARSKATSRSVARTGFLPVGKPGAAGAYDWGTLSRRQVPEEMGEVWFNVNRDDMRLERTWRKSRFQPHLPTCAGVTYRATDFDAEILSGYGWIGRHLLGNSGRRSDLARWRRRLRNCPRRLLVRASVQYQPIIEEILSPGSLRKLPLAINFPSTFVRADAAHAAREASALEELDVPRLRQDPGEFASHDVSGAEISLSEYLEQSRVIADALEREQERGK